MNIKVVLLLVVQKHVIYRLRKVNAEEPRNPVVCDFIVVLYLHG